MGTKHIPISITNSTMPEKGQYSNLLRGADHFSKRFFDKFLLDGWDQEDFE